MEVRRRKNRGDKGIWYLGYTMQKNGKAGKHLEDRCRRAMIATKKTWHLGERLFRDWFKRRIKLFEALVESVILYSAKV